MTLKETMESNKRIARFMGSKYVQMPKEIFSKEKIRLWENVRPKIDLEVYSGLDAPTRLLAYHKSWDWLAPVVEKISSICESNVKASMYVSKCDFLVHIRGEVYAAPNIERVYPNVVEFIEWYNQNEGA